MIEVIKQNLSRNRKPQNKYENTDKLKIPFTLRFAHFTRYNGTSNTLTGKMKCSKSRVLYRPF